MIVLCMSFLSTFVTQRMEVHQPTLYQRNIICWVLSNTYLPTRPTHLLHHLISLVGWPWLLFFILFATITVDSPFIVVCIWGWSVLSIVPHQLRSGCADGYSTADSSHRWLPKPPIPTVHECIEHVAQMYSLHTLGILPLRMSTKVVKVIDSRRWLFTSYDAPTAQVVSLMIFV